MSLFVEFGHGLVAMAVLICFSAFFSGSEAALFYLQRADRFAFRAGNAAQRMAAALLERPERLLMAVLFWNLIINITYFAVASIIEIQLDNSGRRATAGLFGVVTLLAIIFFSEMLPKSLAVLYPRIFAALVSIPLAVAMRLLTPALPVIRAANLVSRRLIWPRFSAEPYLELKDLERAVALSVPDARLLEQEHQTLRRIIALSETRVEELMRPRTQCHAYRPPVTVDRLHSGLPPSGYLLVTDARGDEIVSAVPIRSMPDLSSPHLERYAEQLLYVPWCATVDVAFDEMHRRDREVAAVVDEHGTTIGIVTLDDVLETIFSGRGGRSERLLKRSAIRATTPGVWQVTGMTSLRRLARYFDVTLPESKSITVAGVLQEVLQRVPVTGDQCQWGPFRMRILETAPRGDLVVELWYVAKEETDA